MPRINKYSGVNRCALCNWFAKYLDGFNRTTKKINNANPSPEHIEMREMEIHHIVTFHAGMTNAYYRKGGKIGF